MNNNTIPINFITSSNIIKIYETGNFYNEYVLDKDYYPYQFNSWNDNKKYGIVDNNLNAIYPKQSALLEYSNNFKNAQKNINFVADAFADFKKYQQELSKKSNINNQTIFTKLNAEKTTESLPDLYLQYLKKTYQIFVDQYVTENIKKEILDVSSFINYFIKYIKIISLVSPITRSAFIKSRFCPTSINGLTIFLDSVTQDADYEKKANRYAANPEFDHFIITASKFGFFVDKNYPYKIVADLESPYMKAYAKMRGYFTIDQIFEQCYFKAYTADLEALKNMAIIFWNTYAANNKAQIVNNKNNLSTEVIQYNELTTETFEQFYNINWQIRLYLFVRILEEKINTTQNKFENLYQEAIKINKYSDITNCLTYINQKILELLPTEEQIPNHLTAPDLTVRLLKNQIEPLPVSGINF